MAKLGKLWAGRVYGTNTGNVFMELETSESGVTGTLRFLDTEHGIALYRVAGSFDEKLVLFGMPVNSKPGAELGELTAEAELTPEGNLRGKWTTSNGTGGTFQAFPHDGHAEANQESPSTTPGDTCPVTCKFSRRNGENLFFFEVPPGLMDEVVKKDGDHVCVDQDGEHWSTADVMWESTPRVA